jgi:hypothetical protein
MDSPWRRRWAYWTEDDGEVYRLPVNPVSGTNRALSSDVEWLKVGLWWYEPNIGNASDPWDAAVVSLALDQTDGNYYYTCQSTAPQSQRVWLGNVAGSRAWDVVVNGIDIPASKDTSYYYNRTRRKMFMVAFWEDRDRDDWNGPPSNIE